MFLIVRGDYKLTVSMNSGVNLYLMSGFTTDNNDVNLSSFSLSSPSFSNTNIGSPSVGCLEDTSVLTWSFKIRWGEERSFCNSLSYFKLTPFGPLPCSFSYFRISAATLTDFNVSPIKANTHDRTDQVKMNRSTCSFLCLNMTIWILDDLLVKLTNFPHLFDLYRTLSQSFLFF